MTWMRTDFVASGPFHSLSPRHRNHLLPSRASDTPPSSQSPVAAGANAGEEDDSARRNGNEVAGGHGQQNTPKRQVIAVAIIRV